jgi:hypothetical protein
MAMRSTVIFLAGTLTGGAALAVVIYLFQQSNAIVDPPAASLAQQVKDCRIPVHEEKECSGISVVRSIHKDGAANELGAVESQPDAEWEALVGGMLESEVARRSDEKLTSEKKQRLISELSRLREASLALQQSPAEPDDPAEVRERLTQTLALVQVDQAFRKELGLGVAEFLQGLEPTAVENVPPAAAQP